MAAQLSSHLYSLNRQADLSENKTDANKRSAPIDLIVVTDSEAILGIGDQGVGGITVSFESEARELGVFGGDRLGREGRKRRAVELVSSRSRLQPPRAHPSSSPPSSFRSVQISTSKAALYTLGAGINPNRFVPPPLFRPPLPPSRELTSPSLAFVRAKQDPPRRLGRRNR